MECSICLDELEPENTSLIHKNVTTLVCGHLFHKKCIKKWLHKNNQCPYCRTYFKTKFRGYVTTRGKYIGSFASINIDSDTKEIPLTIYNIICNKRELLFTRFNVISIEYNFKNSIYIKYFKTLYGETKELELYVFNKCDCNHIYEHLIKVIRNHYISKSTITMDTIEEDEYLQNTNNVTNIKLDSKMNDVNILSRGSSLASLSSLNDII
jgi:hypothetical protein